MADHGSRGAEIEISGYIAFPEALLDGKGLDYDGFLQQRRQLMGGR
jgi:hypothetical protein